MTFPAQAELRRLAELLSGIAVDAYESDWKSFPPTAICVDSRSVIPGALFFAIKGSVSDGHKFLHQAACAGARFAIGEASQKERVGPTPLPVLWVPEIRRVLALVASRFYDEPTKELLTIGVTGTNGKTSVAWIAANALRALGKTTGLVGTLGKVLLYPEINESPEIDGLPDDRGSLPDNKRIIALEKTLNTTPDPLELQRFFSDSRQAGAEACVLEVTSQGIAQERTSGIHWDAGIFTNLTRDHLDLHGTLENYAAIKKSFFSVYIPESEKRELVGIVNIDDPIGSELARELSTSLNVRCRTFSLNDRAADYFVKEIRAGLQETLMLASLAGVPIELRTSLVGRYNVSNVLAVAAALSALGYAQDEIAGAIRQVPRVPGRLELVADCDVHVFIDYAHTPDALVNAQSSLREISEGRLITVFGCGGDRDRGKRPLMGEVVANLSDYAVVTSDNPRTENPEQIISDVLPGIEKVGGRSGFSWKKITKRDEAIAFAIAEAKPGDTVLVAGKGHEDYQEIHGIRHPFLDRTVCLEALKSRGII